MKKEFCMMAIGLLLAGCSADEEIANVQTSETNAISFNVVSNNPQTKATPITPTTFKDHPFEVFAFKDGEHFMGRHEEGSWKSDGVEIKYQNNGWTYKNPDDMLYWPHISPLDFYALSPSDNFNLTFPTIQGDSQTFTYTVNDDYGDQSYQGYQNVDVMYALAKNQKKSDLLNGVVTLHFKHALSQVVFKAKKNSDQMQVRIQNMKICTVPTSGTFTFPAKADEKGTWELGLPGKEYRVGLELGEEGYIDVNHTSTPVNLSMNKPMLFIPAKLDPWNTGHSVNQAYSLGESYLEITCKIWQSTETSEDYFVGSASEYGVIYVPFGADWDQGKRYVYTLCFGAGYDENGKEYDIVPITFEAEVEDWLETSVDKGDF